MADVEAGQETAQEEQVEQEQQEEQGEERKQPQRTYTQEEVDRIASKIRKNARYLGRKEAEAELLRQGATQRQAEKAVEKPEPPKAPKREDFENYEDYLEAKADHRAREAAREEANKTREEARQERLAEERRNTESAFRKRAEEAMREIPDFAETIESAEDVMISQAMGESIQESPIGPRILYYLVQNPDEADRIAGLKSAAAQAREIGKLEARIEAELKGKEKPEPKGEKGEEDEEEPAEEERSEAEERDRNRDGTFKSEKKASRRAPEPIEPGSGRSANTTRQPSDKDDVDTWMEKREAELTRRR